MMAAALTGFGDINDIQPACPAHDRSVVCKSPYWPRQLERLHASCTPRVRPALQTYVLQFAPNFLQNALDLTGRGFVSHVPSSISRCTTEAYGFFGAAEGGNRIAKNEQVHLFEKPAIGTLLS
jgi:hypothetical protein